MGFVSYRLLRYLHNYVKGDIFSYTESNHFVTMWQFPSEMDVPFVASVIFDCSNAHGFRFRLSHRIWPQRFSNCFTIESTISIQTESVRKPKYDWKLFMTIYSMHDKQMETKFTPQNVDFWCWSTGDNIQSNPSRGFDKFLAARMCVV